MSNWKLNKWVCAFSRSEYQSTNAVYMYMIYEQVSYYNRYYYKNPNPPIYAKIASMDLGFL